MNKKDMLKLFMGHIPTHILPMAISVGYDKTARI